MSLVDVVIVQKARMDR